MKLDKLELHLDSLQEMVDTVGIELTVKDAYQRAVKHYLTNINPNIYCLNGEEYKNKKMKMREYAYNQTSKLINKMLEIHRRRIQNEDINPVGSDNDY